MWHCFTGSNPDPIQSCLVDLIACAYSKDNPLVVELGKGEHQITSGWAPNGYNRPTTLGITRSNVTFLGKGKDETTILGGFGIHLQLATLFYLFLYLFCLFYILHWWWWWW